MISWYTEFVFFCVIGRRNGDRKEGKKERKRKKKEKKRNIRY